MRARRSHGRQPEPRPVSTLAGALWQEFAAIHGEAGPVSTGPDPDASLRAYYDSALKRDQAALCLSGGGIRSAALSLGVLQGLARYGLLTGFHYLSTVSGGGYIGGWLSAMLTARKGDVGELQELLKADEAPPELRALRGYTSFLAPRPGLASPDSWAGIVLWLRNILVNWIVFVPALFALALMPGLYGDLLSAIGPALSRILLPIALLCLGIGVYNGAVHLPSHAFPDADSQSHRAGFVPLHVVGPILLWSALLPLVVGPWLRPVMPLGTVTGDAIPPLAFAVMELAYLIAGLRMTGEHRRLFWHNFGWWTLASLAAAAVLWMALNFGIGVDPRAVVVLGPLVVTFAHLVQSLIYVAFRTEAFRGDLDREWLARLNAEKVMPTLIWAVFAAACLYLPPLVLDGWHTSFQPFLISVFGLLTGPLAAFLGKISKDSPGAGRSAAGGGLALSFNILIGLIAAVFGAALFMLLARLGAVLSGGNFLAGLFWALVGTAVAWGCGRHVNVNRFSLHAVYRSRLVRAFLGSARRGRKPDGFTGIDPADNPRMSQLVPEGGQGRRLLPVVNVTLNLTSGRNTAWAERKGESFTITPYACGAAFLHRVEDAAAGYPARGAYARTVDFAGIEKERGRLDTGRGISLGTAITLSGAAVSSSMGYHSSAATAFLMTLFNVRLGAWLPNPATAAAAQLRRAQPPNALLTLASELLGRTHDRGPAVYLTDGGHFEDLGLYEMVRRRCRHIVAIDAGEDPQSRFGDLGNAIRKIRIDLDVEIRFEPPIAIGSPDRPLSPFRNFACATIHYPESRTPGRLLYLKPVVPPDSPVDVRAYQNLHAAFPHESTAEQFFTESQFESYRRLGQAEVESVARDAASLADLFLRADRLLAQPSAPGP
jgi:hypothetical protein